jgi:hypothetical protein
MYPRRLPRVTISEWECSQALAVAIAAARALRPNAPELEGNLRHVPNKDC